MQFQPANGPGTIPATPRAVYCGGGEAPPRTANREPSQPLEQPTEQIVRTAWRRRAARHEVVLVVGEREALEVGAMLTLREMRLERFDLSRQPFTYPHADVDRLAFRGWLGTR